MNWINDLQKAINYLEDNLTEDISYADVAGQANYSPYHFQNVFSILCGCTLGEYIRCRRLTLAGKELASTKCRVIDVALKYGYDSPDSFGRAFSRFHGITPSQARLSGAKLNSFSRLSVKLILDGGSTMNYRVETRGEIEVIVRKRNFSDNLEENNRQLPAFWEECRRDQTLDKLSAYQAAEDIFGNALIGMCLSENAQEKEITYAIGAGYHGEPVGEGLSVERIAANTWVVFEGTGPMPGAFQELQKKVYSEFFPGSEYRPLSGMDIQVYPQGDMQSPQYRCELWIPVETDKQVRKKG